MSRFYFKILVWSCVLLMPIFVSATSYTVDIYATVAGCGDGLIQSGEQCDGSNLGGATCESLGFDSGTVQCSSACTFITASCVLLPPSTGTGGTRVTETKQPVSSTNMVVFGEAVPFSTVSLLKDGQRVATVPVSESGMFQITVAGLSGGTYRVVLVGEKAGFPAVVSETMSVRVLKNATTKVGPMVLPPFVRFIEEGTSVTVRGYAPIMSSVSLIVGDAAINRTVSLNDGMFEFRFDTSLGSLALIQVETKDAQIVRSISYTLTEGVDEERFQNAPCSQKGDINGDCRVGPVDFFISRFRFIKDLFSNRFDFNSDGELTIVDFSIMAFYWTG